MSHFSVAVISEKHEDIERLMAPYQENNMGDCPKEFLEFVDMEPECREQYENGTVEKIRMPNGELLTPWDSVFLTPEINDIGVPTGRTISVIPDDCELVKIPHKEVYPTFEAFVEDEYGYEKDPKTGKYGYWENPNSKWDYWRIGGRWRGTIPAAEGERSELMAWEFTVSDEKKPTDKPCRFDSAKIKHLILDLDEDALHRAERYWEVVVEDSPLQEGESKEDFPNYYKTEYFYKKYGDKATYANMQSKFNPWALVTPDGKWYEQGRMGWFACSDSTNDSSVAFLEFFEKTIKESNPEFYITVLDCHI